MKKIAVIGASYLQLPLVKKAKEMELQVHCFAWEDGAVCKEYADYFYPISILDKEEILKVCKDVQIDAITTIASDVAVLTVNYVASNMGLISNPIEYTEITTNKYLMRECFSKNKVPSPKFSIARRGSNLDIDGFNFPLIVKPTDRSGSRGVTKIDTFDTLHDALSRAQDESFSGNAIIEEYVSGREISVETISNDGIHYILQITDKVTTGSPYFVELEHHQPTSLPEPIAIQVKKIVLSALDALHIKFGASHSELKITETGDIKVIEVGARMGGDFIGSTLVQLSTGYDFLEGVINVALGQFKVPKFSESNYSGVYFLSKETEYLYEIIQRGQFSSQIVEAQITDRRLRNIQNSSDRSGYLIYKSNCKLVL